MKISNVEFQQTPCFQDARKSPSLMASHNAGFVFGQYDRSLEMPDNFTLGASDDKFELLGLWTEAVII
jgi:hypothetical protein